MHGAGLTILVLPSAQHCKKQVVLDWSDLCYEIACRATSYMFDARAQTQGTLQASQAAEHAHFFCKGVFLVLLRKTIAVMGKSLAADGHTKQMEQCKALSTNDE